VALAPDRVGGLFMGGKFEIADNEPGKPVRLIYFWGKRVTDKDLALLKSLPDLRRIDLRDANVTDEGLQLLSKMPALEVPLSRNVVVAFQVDIYSGTSRPDADLV
jgi:hypothetical protein